MHLAHIVARALFAYLFLLLVVRVSGKRSIRQVNPVDITAWIIISDLVDDLLWAEVPAAQFVVAVSVLMLAAVAVTAAGCLSPGFRRLVWGLPLEVIRDGAILGERLREARLPEVKLAALLREHSLDDVRELESGMLETSGRLGIARHEWAREAQKQDLVRVRQVAAPPQEAPP